MNLSDDEEAPAAGREPGKRKIGEVEPSKPRPSGFRYLTSSSALESFGDLRAFSFDKFGALRDAEEERPNVYRRIQTTLDSSTGSFTPEGINGNKQSQAGADVNDSSSTWSKYFDADWENEETSYPGGGVEAADLTSYSSEPIFCTLHERRSVKEGPTLQELSILPQQDEDRTHGEFPQNELAGVASELPNDFEPVVNAAAGSLPSALSRDSFYHCHRTRSVPLFSDIDRPAATLLLPLAPPGRSSSWSSQYKEEEGEAINLPRFARNMASPSSDGEEDSRESTAHYPSRIDYRFASVSLEASLLQRMEERERLQNEAGKDERVCGHVISPEDLIWGSVKHYCGMVLDRETRALLGTAILFMPPDPQAHQQAAAAARGTAPSSSSRPLPKSAWVTCVKVVEGRTEVLIKNNKGDIHEALLLLTSTTLGLALFSVRVRQATFALAFLRRVAGPASLPHRLFVDVARSDRVYVIGYEEPWESEAGTIADVRVRPGRIVDAGRHAIVEIDFTAGRLGGSINCPAGFRGGLVVRADGLLEGVVTGEVLGDHPTNIDISSAFNVYALLEELQD